MLLLLQKHLMLHRWKYGKEQSQQNDDDVDDDRIYKSSD
jgi:hypothetical protein